jgi:methyltransferase-like protein
MESEIQKTVGGPCRDFEPDDIYNYQLLEGTKFILGRMLRNSSQDDIVETILEMYKNGSLCRIDEDRNKCKDPQIICSMGLRSE